MGPPAAVSSGCLPRDKAAAHAARCRVQGLDQQQHAIERIACRQEKISRTAKQLCPAVERHIFFDLKAGITEQFLEDMRPYRERVVILVEIQSVKPESVPRKRK